MKRQEDIINSLQGAHRAAPKPFLFTRIMARLNKQEKEEHWLLQAIYFISRPAVMVIAAMLVVLSVWMATGNTTPKTPGVSSEEYAGLYDYYSIENLYK